MNKIVIISRFDYRIDILKKRKVVDEIENSFDFLSKESVLYYLENFDKKDLILIHSSEDFEIEDYNIVYFSFRCPSCGQKKNNGDLIKSIINDISDTTVSQTSIDRYRQQLQELVPKVCSLLNEERDIFIINYKNKPIPSCEDIDNCYLYISDKLKMDNQTKAIFEKVKKSSTKDELKNIISNSRDFLYLIVPFAGYGYPKILVQDGDIESIDYKYNSYFLELKELQEESDYNIIFLFLSYTDSYIPDFFKDFKNKSGRDKTIWNNINKIFVSPLKHFNRDNHNKFLFAETIYTPNKKLLNFFDFSDTTIDIKPIQSYLKDNMLEDGLYQQLKKIYYSSLFFDKSKITEKKIIEYKKYWEIHKELKYEKYDEHIFHDFDLADIRTNMPFYISSMFNKLGVIKQTFKHQTLDFLLIDDNNTIDSKRNSIEKILKLVFQDDSRYRLKEYCFDKNYFNRAKKLELIDINSENQNIRNSNFILIDFVLDPEDNIFFGSDFIERIEKTKKEEDEQFKSWYFITSYLSSYVNKFEIDKIMYEYHETAIVQLGDSTHEKFRIFFIKKLIHFIYSKVNIYVRIINITKKLKKDKNINLMKKLIILMQTLLQQIDLLELRYDEQIKIAQQFYTLSSQILQDYIYGIDYKWEVKEIKFQETKRLYKQLKDSKNREIDNIHQLIKILLFKGNR